MENKCLACDGTGEVCECADDMYHDNVPITYATHEFTGTCVCGCPLGAYYGMECDPCSGTGKIDG